MVILSWGGNNINGTVRIFPYGVEFHGLRPTRALRSWFEVKYSVGFGVNESFCRQFLCFADLHRFGMFRREAAQAKARPKRAAGTLLMHSLPVLNIYIEPIADWPATRNRAVVAMLAKYKANIYGQNI